MERIGTIRCDVVAYRIRRADHNRQRNSFNSAAALYTYCCCRDIFSIKKAQISTWKEILFTAFSGVPLVVIVGLLVQFAGSWWTAIIGVVLMNLLIAVIVARKPLISNLPERYLKIGKPAGILIKRMLIIYTGVSALTLLGFSIFQVPNVLAIQALFNQGILGTIGIVFLQLLYLPVLLIWAGAWITGAGVTLGSGSAASILGSQIGLLPAIPMLGLIPGPNFGAPWMLVFPLAIFMLSGIVLIRIQKVLFPDLKTLAAAGAIAALISVLIIEIFGALAGGSIGPGRMAEFGPAPTHLAFHALLLFPCRYSLE
ncbi:DUF6350 family protein [Arcanobacterium hippocoleae]